MSEEEAECGAELVWSAHLGPFGLSLSWLGLTWVGLGGSSGGLGGGQTNAAVDPRQMWLWLERQPWFCGESCCGPSQKRVGTPKYARKATIPLDRSIWAVWSIWGIWGIWSILPRNHPPNKRKRALGGPEEAGSLRSHSHEGSLGSHSHEALGATATRP